MSEKNKKEKKVHEKNITTYKTTRPVRRKKPCPPKRPKPRPGKVNNCGKISIEEGPVIILINCDCEDNIKDTIKELIGK